MNLGTAVLEQLVEPAEIVRESRGRFDFKLNAHVVSLYAYANQFVIASNSTTKRLQPRATPGEIARALSEVFAAEENKALLPITLDDIAGRVLYLGRYTLGTSHKPALVCASNEGTARVALGKLWRVVEHHIELSEPTEEERGRHTFVLLAARDKCVPIDDFLKVYRRTR
jgi:hypothetical protein